MLLPHPTLLFGMLVPQFVSCLLLLFCFVREDLETLGVVCGGRELAGESVPLGAFEGFL